jgi:hypothetical protein
MCKIDYRSPPSIHIVTSTHGESSNKIFLLLENKFLFGGSVVGLVSGTPDRPVLNGVGKGGRVCVPTIDGCESGPSDELLIAAALFFFSHADTVESDNFNFHLRDVCATTSRFEVAQGSGKGVATPMAPSPSAPFNCLLLSRLRPQLG